MILKFLLDHLTIQSNKWLQTSFKLMVLSYFTYVALMPEVDMVEKYINQTICWVMYKCQRYLHTSKL